MQLKLKIRQAILFFAALLCAGTAAAQEQVTSVNYNPFAAQGNRAAGTASKTTALTLPFFEDFTGTDARPDAAKWVEAQVYVNNTMCVGPVSRGVATFDALNAQGRPYDTLNNTNLLYADSLTTTVIDLSSYQASDNIYLSFFYQPQGNGFSPETSDSLMLFFLKNTGDWVKVWAKEGTTLQPFTQVMVPVTDPAYFHAAFQFRFVNKASINTNDDVWNLDYIRMAANRNANDTAVNDLAFTENPGFLLNDLTYMPYRQFLANAGAERAAQIPVSIRNNYSSSQSVVFTFTAREKISNTPLYTANNNPLTIPAKTDLQTPVNNYTNTIPAPGPYDKVVFENKFFLNSSPAGENKVNDSIVLDQVFDNYLAYDDGTAEKSYYLNLFPTLPGKVAVEYHLNQPDTLRGVAIYFGRQVPVATNKYFSVAVYSSITPNSPAETNVYQQDLFAPGYVDTVNHFYYYKFDTPVPLPSGIFYVGTTQPALSGSDSLYIGLDANRVTGNHLYYNVLDQWVSSTVTGALMIRPLLGQPISGTGVSNVAAPFAADWSVYPNPATSTLYFDRGKTARAAAYEITDMQGRLVQTGRLQAEGQSSADISSLLPGIYLVRLQQNGISGQPKKLVKL